MSSRGQVSCGKCIQGFPKSHEEENEQNLTKTTAYKILTARPADQVRILCRREYCEKRYD